uniref:AlNc14C80G5253 protein n=1 Tax=Albugo laibachii Nc14 TaxID=890382 RepID=F0WF59_9STRA|nr:AlNc14C80G5253 [Albugo laibachii Nc14]|eukprot:CCA19841.1 AlNc14C80G5253 [Albugo laibachii Nc14]
MARVLACDTACYRMFSLWKNDETIGKVNSEKNGGEAECELKLLREEIQK